MASNLPRCLLRLSGQRVQNSVARNACVTLAPGKQHQAVVLSRVHFRPLSVVASPVEDLEMMKRKKRLTWRAKSRGWLELDVLMGTFVEKHIADFDEPKLDLLEEVLELENPDLFKWFTQQAPVPDELVQENPVMKLMMEWVNKDHSGHFTIK
eukprot:symbB.v1.2.004482.t1/scaffold254.1/size251309/5